MRCKPYIMVHPAHAHDNVHACSHASQCMEPCNFLSITVLHLVYMPTQCKLNKVFC